MTLDQLILETVDGGYFTTIGNLQKPGILIGLMVYIPLEDRHIAEPVIKTKLIGERKYAKMSTLWHWHSHQAYFHYLSKFSHYFYEDNFFGKVIAIPEEAVKRRFPPRQLADRLTNSVLEKSCTLLGIDISNTAQTGSILLTGRNGFDIDLAVYGRKDVMNLVKNLKTILQESEYQEIRYHRVHQKMMRMNGLLIDFFPLYKDSEELPFSTFPEYMDGPLKVEDVISDEYDSAFTPSVYKLKSGRLLISYQMGHKLLLREGDKLSVKAHEVKLSESPIHQENTAYLIRLGDEWEDPTEEKRFSEDGT